MSFLSNRHNIARPTHRQPQAIIRIGPAVAARMCLALAFAAVLRVLRVPSANDALDHRSNINRGDTHGPRMFQSYKQD